MHSERLFCPWLFQSKQRKICTCCSSIIMSLTRESFQMLLGKLCFRVMFGHGLPSCKACIMTIQLVLACLCFHLLSLLFSSMFAFSFQGLAHLKAEQGTLFSLALYCFCFCAPLIGLVLGHSLCARRQDARGHSCAVMIPSLLCNSRTARLCCVL